MKKSKKKLTPEQEFEIMKLVLDKFLWLGFGIMAFGLYYNLEATTENIFKGFLIMVSGVAVLILFMVLLVREYEVFE